MNISREGQLKLLSKMKDEDIDFSDIPETDPEFWANAKIDYPVIHNIADEINLNIKIDKNEVLRNNSPHNKK